MHISNKRQKKEPCSKYARIAEKGSWKPLLFSINEVRLNGFLLL
jgi:hypothetical protein